MTERPCDLRGKNGQPLRVLITRPDEQAEETAELVRAAGGKPLVYPCLFRAPPPDSAAFLDALKNLDRYDVIAITSANAALAFAEGLRGVFPNASSLKNVLGDAVLAAVGPRTALALREQGLPPTLVPSGDNTAEGLAALISASQTARGRSLENTRVFFPRALEARTALASALRGAGAEVFEAVAYQMTPAASASLLPIVELLRKGQVDLAPFGSPRTVAIALNSLGGRGKAAQLLAGVLVGAVGPTTAAALEEFGVAVDVVARPATFSALLSAMSERHRGS